MRFAFFTKIIFSVMPVVAMEVCEGDENTTCPSSSVAQFPKLRAAYDQLNTAIQSGTASSYLKENDVSLLRGKNDFTLLHLATQEQNFEMVRVLCATYPDLALKLARNGDSVLCSAVHNNNIEMVRYFCANYPQLLEATHFAKYTALLYATVNNNLEMVKYLSQQCETLAATGNEYGQLPIHWAAEKGYLDIVQYLSIRYPDQLTKKHLSMTPLEFACLTKHFECVKFLCQQHEKAGHNMTEVSGASLGLAANKGNLDIIKYLCQYHQTLDDLTYHKECTVLHNAAQFGRIEAVKFFCLNYPNLIRKTDKFNSTCLHTASYYGKLPVIKYLIDNYPDLAYMVNFEGSTLLHCAAGYSKKEAVIKYLCLQYPKFLIQKDFKGRTAKQVVPPYNPAIYSVIDGFELIHKLGLDPNTAATMPWTVSNLSQVDTSLLKEILDTYSNISYWARGLKRTLEQYVINQNTKAFCSSPVSSNEEIKRIANIIDLLENYT